MQCYNQWGKSDKHAQNVHDQILKSQILKSQQIWAPRRIFHLIFSLPLNTCQFSAVLAHLYSLINSYIPFFFNATHDPKEWYK